MGSWFYPLSRQIGLFVLLFFDHLLSRDLSVTEAIDSIDFSLCQAINVPEKEPVTNKKGRNMPFPFPLSECCLRAYFDAVNI